MRYNLKERLEKKAGIQEESSELGLLMTERQRCMGAKSKC